MAQLACAVAAISSCEILCGSHNLHTGCNVRDGNRLSTKHMGFNDLPYAKGCSLDQQSKHRVLSHIDYKTELPDASC